MGLVGSGSHDVAVHDAFVPVTRVVYPGRMSFGADSPGWRIHQQARYWMPYRSLLVWDLVAPLVGIAQAALEEFTRRLSGKSGPGRTADSGALQIRLTRSAAEVDAARALLRQDIHEMFGLARQHAAFPDLDRARYARDKAYVSTICLEAVHRLWEVAGGHALFKDDAFQRLYRDATAVAHRDGLSLDFGGEPYARLALDLTGTHQRLW
jgi:3-hydroxy-9,10-secoandrosta-1,3,5(10)-triene-9,17-dione monooxygenase